MPDAPEDEMPGDVFICCFKRGRHAETCVHYKPATDIPAETRDDALDAKRWRWLRQFLSVESDYDAAEDGTHVQWIRVDEEKLLDAAQPGWTHTVESIADAALSVPVQGEP